MSSADIAIEHLLSIEKGLEENAKDKGGITNGGISLRFLKSIPTERLKTYGIYDTEVTDETIRNLTKDQMKAIYTGEFWDHAPFAEINDQDLCNYVFSMAVNIGIAPAIKCLQRAYWADTSDWKSLPDDGILGKSTLLAINSSKIPATSSNVQLLSPLRAEIGSHYRAIVQHDPEQKEFINGWYNRAYCT